MPRLDFWNNPLVVTAFRLKSRRRSLPASTTLYLLLLLGLGALLHRYWNDPAIPWIRAYLVFLLGLQFVFSGFGAAIATSTSMHAEVNQRTLDFQRLTPLSPLEILLGKMLGEPASSYLQAIAMFPLALWCGLAGAAGLDVIVLFFLQMMTLCLMMSALGFAPLEPAAQGSGVSPKSSVSVGAAAIVFVLVMSAAQAAQAARAARGGLAPDVGAISGTLLPICDLLALFHGQAALPAVNWFGVSAPCLWIAPWVQLLIAGAALRGMCRKLLNPNFSLLGKPAAYAVIVLVDALIAGLIYVPPPAAWPLDRLTAVFAGCHLAVALLLLLDLTAGKAALLSWLWRFRGRESWLASSLYGERGENTLAALTFAALGLADWLLLVWLPAWVSGGGPALPLTPETLDFLCGGALLLLAAAIALQWAVLVSPKSGATLLAILAAPVIVAPAILGRYYHLPWLQALSPLGHVIAWAEQQPLPFFPFYVLYGLFLCGGWSLLRRRWSDHAAIIDSKLAVMLAPEGGE